MMKFSCSCVSILLVAAALPVTAPAQPTVAGVTATQAVLQYQAPGPAACSVQVSPNQSMSPLAADVDPGLFPGADQDNRAGNLTTQSGTGRYFVVGKKRSDLASDGNRYSRALQLFTEYFFQINCGGTIQSGRFVTANPPLGNNFNEPPPFDPTAFGNYAWPTIDWNNASKTYIDPLTGVLIKRATGPGWYGSSQTGKKFGFAVDLNSAWTNAANILSGSASTVANYSGPGSDPIFVSLDPSQMQGFGAGFSNWQLNQTLDNIMVRVYGTGTGTLSGCLSDDSGAHCISPAVSLLTLNSSGGNPAGTYPAACASDLATGCFPNNGFWGGWGFTPGQWQMSGAQGTVNVTGSAVTAGLYTEFNLNWKPGSKIYIAGASCAYSLCTIASVNSSSSLTIWENAGTLNAAGFKTAGSGVVLWVNKGSGTASISVNFDYAYSDQITMPLNGTTAQCSPIPTTVSWAADGVTPMTPAPGQLCLAGHQAGPSEILYLLIPSTGETRLLAPIWFVNSSDNSADQPQDPVAASIHMVGASFDATDPNTIYAQASATGGVELFRGVYNAAVYKYKAYPHSLYPNASAGYSPGQDTTQYWYRGAAWSDTGITWTNITKGSQGQDLSSQIARSDSNWDPGLFHAPALTQISNGRAFTVNSPMSNANPESITLIHSFDLSTGLLAQTTDTWHTFPTRWCAMHTNEAFEGWYGLVCNPLGGTFSFSGSRGVLGIGPWQTTPTAMLKNGAFTSDTSMNMTAPLDACPVIPSYLLSFAPANPRCVTFQSKMACSFTPYPGENTKWPCEYNPNYSELQPLAPGDALMILNGQAAVETVLIVSVTSLGNANYQFTAIRGASNQGLQNVTTGWVSYVLPPSANCQFGACTPGVGMWFDSTVSSVTWRLDPGAFAGHSDLGNGPTPGANSFCQSGQCRYNVPMAQQIGSFAGAFQFYYGSFNGVQGSIATQGYPSVHQLTAPPSEKTWQLNFAHINPSYGIGAEVPADVGAVSYSLVSGTQGVFKFTSVSGGVNYKTAPLVAYAGYHLLQDVSSPAQGNVITDSTPWQFCVAWYANECRSGSNPGEVYLSAPQGIIRSTQNCVSNWYDDNYPCVFTPPVLAANGYQEDITRNDQSGSHYRRITMGLSGPGRQYQFGSFIPDPTGAWGFMQGYWMDGKRNDLLLVKLPPWPNPHDITTNRSGFVMQSIQVSGNQNLNTARVRFGYAENGPAGSFFCTPRQEACVTGGSPYSFLSENPQWQACSGGCIVQVPAIPGRVLFYTVDGQDSNGKTIPGAVQVRVVP